MSGRMCQNRKSMSPFNRELLVWFFTAVERYIAIFEKLHDLTYSIKYQPLTNINRHKFEPPKMKINESPSHSGMNTVTIYCWYSGESTRSISETLGDHNNGNKALLLKSY